MANDNKPTPTYESAGRPEFVPTDAERKQVEAMAGYGVPQDKIATLVRNGINKTTLIKHFRAELDRGIAMADLQVSKTLFQQATSGNTSALIFWAKARMGWRETQNIDHTTNGESLNRPATAEAALAAFAKSNDD